ncbi:hypothetical protein [Rhodococcus koreensis]|uniref:DUF7065 domain-containing protein n=1 Tax=Rhodococcus koreensis TaxID=99653 RepID=UPI00366C8EEC
MDPNDDFPHAIGPESNFNESMYYHFADRTSGLNGFLRLANRPNEGRGERTLCLFHPDGAVSLSFDRPVFADHAAYDAGGVRIDIREPFRHHHIAFSGSTSVFPDPWALEDPKRAFASTEAVPCTLRLDAFARSEPVEFSLDGGGDFVPHHYDQFMDYSGVLNVGGREYLVDGQGMRDHSWGPRSWAAPRYYRWLFGACEDFAFAAGVLARDGVPNRAAGFVWDQGRVTHVDHVEVHTTWNEHAITSLEVTLVGHDASWTVTGAPGSSVPLRHRSPAGVTRILETSVLWSHGTSAMLGIAEYLDRMNDGVALGVVEYDAPDVAHRPSVPRPMNPIRQNR